MTSRFRSLFSRVFTTPPPWNDTTPIRQELFSAERLEQHAESLARAQTVSPGLRGGESLSRRLDDNAALLLAAYRAGAAELEAGRPVVPAAEWLLDNYHVVEEQIREIRGDLPPGYYRQLPKLAAGPFKGYPRVFGLAWAFVAHTDSNFDIEKLCRFITAYQRVQTLTIGELWAVAITLRIVLVENLRRIADQITVDWQARMDADDFANRLLAAEGDRGASEVDSVPKQSGLLNDHFASQLAKRLRDLDPRTTPALSWLESRLNQQGLSVEDAVVRAQHQQGASNVTVRNIITSMRFISSIDWAELVESVSDVDARLRAGSAFGAMDFTTRNLYRGAIEVLARGSAATELDVAERALLASRKASAAEADATEKRRVGDPGYFLIGEGRRRFERDLVFTPSLRLRFTRTMSRVGIAGYAFAVNAATLVLLALSVWLLWMDGLNPGWLAIFALLGFFPATQLATTLANRTITWIFQAKPLPALELVDGVPRSLRTLVVSPTLLTSEEDIIRQVENLEIHYLSASTGDLAFALLSDGVDADQEVLDSDDRLIRVAADAIATLNRRHAPGPCGPRFLLLHRRRVHDQGERKWMGWERKRGKLHELNRLLRGAADTTFIPVDGAPPTVPSGVRFVITLDADTRLPRDAARRLIGKMAHPLNLPRFCERRRRVVEGYAILQPRVVPVLPPGEGGSLYQRVFAGPGGLDPYAAAVSDVYQDLVGEGSYTGKGIYDVEAFERALADKIPEGSLLSHDLFEGIFARAGLASDVEVFEDFPARYDVIASRQHRWTRGDWQLLPWIVSGRKGHRQVGAVGRWKMLDNIRRSVLAPVSFMALGVSWLFPMPSSLIATTLILAAMGAPAYVPVVSSVLHPRAGNQLRNHFGLFATDMWLATTQWVLSIVFMADQAWRMADAVIRTLIRVYWTRRHLLEWTTAAQLMAEPELGLARASRKMAAGTALGLAMSAGAIALVPASWPVALPFAIVWLAAPAIAVWVSRAPQKPWSAALSAADSRELRTVARQTWRFLETFVTPADNMLPPDNFQESPKPVIARRTSPTNIGLYLLSAVAARDFGWAGTVETVERLEATFETLKRMERHRGHFFNWYATADLSALAPHYISSVDSGNLAGHLIALANACEEWKGAPIAAMAQQGIGDTVHLAQLAGSTLADRRTAPARQASSTLALIAAELAGAQSVEMILQRLERLSRDAAIAAREIPGSDGRDDLVFWVDALQKTVAGHCRDRRIDDESKTGEARSHLDHRLTALAAIARSMAMDMDFGFLLDPQRKLLSIGYSLADSELDPSCYDLLASEARLASIFAIAKGDAPTRHWFRLGRAATPIGSGSALISWSGSMFEYLMPSLVMRAPVGSLLEHTNELVVRRQQAYGRSLGLPWGVSESAFNARDLEFTYQYSNFGVPGLGLKRGLSENVVIAPYATALAAMVDAPGAIRNFRHLSELGARGQYGYYEALDFTRSRLPENREVAIVRNFMAHHQGMTIVAIANALDDGRMRDRFHREPIIRATELLLQERMPRDIAVTHPRAEEVKASPAVADSGVPAVRRLPASVIGPPVTHLLSNGRYAVMLTASGSGYSCWRDIMVTRWREDTTQDDRGSFIYLRDTSTGGIWSVGPQPVESDPDHSEVIFDEDHVEFIRREGAMTTTMDVLVSAEDDGEVRRVSLTNSGRRVYDIEVTSYAELSLTSASADSAHPAFAKMFVQTEYLQDLGAIVATRRPRSANEAPVFAAHFAVVEGQTVGSRQYETDRARFMGRGRAVGSPSAVMDGRALSNTVGTVLDPVFSIRHRVRIQPGKVARIAFWTVVAPSRPDLLDVIDRHLDRSAYDRAKTLAWTQAQVQLRHSDVSADEAANFQTMAAPLLYADRRYRAPRDAILRGANTQSVLWQYSISGDLPIVLLRIDDIQDLAQVRQLLRAHEYWRMKSLDVDVVIINERASSYIQDLQAAIEAAVRRGLSRPRFGDTQPRGSVHVQRADLMTMEARALLQSAARVALIAHRGPFADQIARVPEAVAPTARAMPRRVSILPTRRASPQEPPELEFFNGIGGFDNEGREYVMILDRVRATPAPWVNVIANPGFGFHVPAEGGGYTWAENSRENKLTPWSNDPVRDPVGEAIYISDEKTGEVWCPTAKPVRASGVYTARHGFGYSRFEHEANGIALDLVQFVPMSDPIKISRLTLRNVSDIDRRLSVTTFVEWVLGVSREASAPFIITEMDTATGAMFARNPWSIAQSDRIASDRIAFADMAGRQTSWTADRSEFLGYGGSAASPAALYSRTPLSCTTGAGLDPCATLREVVDLPAGHSVEVVFCIGQCRSAEEARSLVLQYREADLDRVLQDVRDHWDRLLGAVQVKTPDRSMDIMLNGWLLYQTLACRIWARSAFYQASGAYGFRDQLQDGMALSFVLPEETRRHLLRAAGRQFVEGDVQHWWLPHSGQGVRTRISDDRVWLAYATATYVATSGDTAVLDEIIPFLEGPPLGPGEHDAFFQPMIADETGTLFDHCALALDQAFELTGDLGLPLIGTGDWNDGMNRVGEGGRGQSVWLGWLLIRTVEMVLPLAEARVNRGLMDQSHIDHWRASAATMREAIEANAWDGAWYRRATFDNGEWLGSKDSEECRIDSIAQTWAVLSGAADPGRAATAMASLEDHLILPVNGLALLFTPPFDTSTPDPGYIKGYPPGLRENGGQYSHAAMWAILALAKLGHGDKAAGLFAMINPVNHARTLSEAERYKVEPYVVSADVYSVAPHAGRGGWSWYTGSAAWMYRAGVEGILGIRRAGGEIVIDPCIPAEWPGFEATLRIGSTRCAIRVDNPSRRCRGLTSATLDGADLECGNGQARIPLDGGEHTFVASL